mmetsp:Transcript_58313/g.165555  ORF Transcript_58313/g.165555 Transcript_58313/m.165555 type:complete len:434 (+) Transcript_58313:167-1468(+)
MAHWVAGTRLGEAQLAVGIVTPRVDLAGGQHSQGVARRRRHLDHLHVRLPRQRLAQSRGRELVALRCAALAEPQLALNVAAEGPNLLPVVRDHHRVSQATGHRNDAGVLELADGHGHGLVVDAADAQLAVGVGAPGEEPAVLHHSQVVVVARRDEPDALLAEVPRDELGHVHELRRPIAGRVAGAVAQLAVAVVPGRVDGAGVADEHAVARTHGDLPDFDLRPEAQHHRGTLLDVRALAQCATSRGAERIHVASSGEQDGVRLAGGGSRADQLHGAVLPDALHALRSLHLRDLLAHAELHGAVRAAAPDLAQGPHDEGGHTGGLDLHRLAAPELLDGEDRVPGHLPRSGRWLHTELPSLRIAEGDDQRAGRRGQGVGRWAAGEAAERPDTPGFCASTGPLARHRATDSEVLLVVHLSRHRQQRRIFPASRARG